MAKKRYDEGGVTEGENKGIDDDTRARALKWAKEQEEKGSEDESSGEKTISRSTKTKAVSKPAERKGASVDDESGRSRGRPAEGEPKGTMGATRTRTREESIAAIPTGGKKGAGPTESKGNSASGSELGRNVTNTLNALTPGGARAARVGSATVKGVKELVESRQAAKAAETARAAREAKTLNPNAWMAGPKGMKENFKTGGSVKGWGSARGARKAKIY